MRLSPRLWNHPRPSGRGGLAARRHVGTWFLLLVGFSVGVAPIHCALYSCHVAAKHDAPGHHGAAQPAVGDAPAETGATPHDHLAGSQGPDSDECICAEFDPPGAMTPASMSTVPAVLGAVAVMPLPLPQGQLAPIEQRTLDEVRVPDLQPPRG